MQGYKELVKRYNTVKRTLIVETSYAKRTELIAKYNAEDISHLAKILALRGISL